MLPTIFVKKIKTHIVCSATLYPKINPFIK